MSLPWMPLYIRDYLADTAHLRAAQSGAYLHLIMHYWQRGSLPDDDDQLAAIAKMTDKEWRQNRSLIEAFFQPGWKHPRIDAEKAKAGASYARRLAYLVALDARRPQPIEWAEIRERIFRRDDFTCTYCGQRGGDLECDHVVPIARGGSNDDTNLTTACMPCNRSKGSQLLSEMARDAMV